MIVIAVCLQGNVVICVLKEESCNIYRFFTFFNSLNGTDVEIFSSAQHAAAEAKAAIDASEYHNTVRTFLKRYDRFPTSGLASLVGLKMPQVFS